MELKDGEYYFINWYSKNSPMIFKHNPDEGDSSLCNGIMIKDRHYGIDFIFSRPCEYRNLLNIRLATEQEKAHLQACILANKYVEPSQNQELNLIIW